MPPTVIGLLTGETQGQYILNPMLETVDDEETFEEGYISVGMNLISKLHTWRCQILEYKPDGVREAGPQNEATGSFNESGGLG